SNNLGFDIAYQFQVHGTSDPDIILNQYGSNGLLIGSPHVIANSGASEANPSVAMDQVGNAVVVYQKFLFPDFNIKAKRVSSTGAVGSEISFRTNPAQETRPVVAVSPTGGAFVVAYQTDLLGAPPGTNRTVEISEFSGSDVFQGFVNLGALPNNSSP